MTELTEYQLRFTIALGAFVLGVFVGYILWHRSKDSKTLTALQVMSVGAFFAYLGITSFGNAHYSDLVAVSILAMTGGEPFGKALAKFTDKINKDSK